VATARVASLKVGYVSNPPRAGATAWSIIIGAVEQRL